MICSAPESYQGRLTIYAVCGSIRDKLIKAKRNKISRVSMRV